MIFLVVSREEQLKDIVVNQFSDRGVAVIHYRNPIKAMDNLEEILPDIVVFYTQDFPRHWKPFVRYYRTLKEKEKGIAILCTGDLFTEDEAAKAQLLGVNGLVPYPQEIHLINSSLEEILQRYLLLQDERLSRRYTPRDYDDLAFMFNHPETFAIVTGTIIDINNQSVRFYPDAPEKTASLPENLLIDSCSLQLGDTIMTFAARVVRNNKTITMTLEGLGDEDRDTLSAYFSRAAERALAVHRG